jgi:hypothetical protein
MSSPTMTRNQGAQELAHRMAQEIEAVIQRASSSGRARDYEPGGGAGWGGAPAGTMSTSGAIAPPEVEQRFLPALAALLPVVVSAVPSIVSNIRDTNRDLIAPSRGPEESERDFLSVLGAITPKLVESLPDLISTLQSASRDLPRDQQEATARFFGSVMEAFVPPIIKAAPAIAATFLGGRRELPTRVDDPEMATRFIGPLLSSTLPVLLPQVPKLMKLFG